MGREEDELNLQIEFMSAFVPALSLFEAGAGAQLGH
jgi:hypothetical protein